MSDSLEDIDYVPNRSSLLATSQELEHITKELERNRSQTFNEYFKDTLGKTTENGHICLQPRAKRRAPARPPPPDPRRVKAPRETGEIDWIDSTCGSSDRSSIDSGTSLHSDSSGNILLLLKSHTVI